MSALVNLCVDLTENRFDEHAYAQALRSIETAGFRVERATHRSDAFLAWLDEEFGGAWSSEAFVGDSIVATRGDAFAGFATFDPRGLQFSWLRGLGAQPGVGIFGPFGVAPAFRGSPIGRQLLLAALCALKQRGYSRALVPAVGHDKLVRYYAAHGQAVVAETFDKAQWQKRRYRTVVLASGNGSNFQSIVEASAAGTLPLEIAALVTNNASAYALERATSAGIASICLPWDRSRQTRAQFDETLLRAVRAQTPELVLLLGWMHLLSDAFVTLFEETLNVHPAFLPLDQRRTDVGFPDGSITPAFRGADAVGDALAWGSRWSGASVHRVISQADRGPVLVRKPMRIAVDDTKESILARLHPIEHRTLAGAVMRWVYER